MANVSQATIDAFVNKFGCQPTMQSDAPGRVKRNR